MSLRAPEGPTLKLDDLKITTKVLLVMALLGSVSVGLLMFSTSKLAAIDSSYAQLVDHHSPALVRSVRESRMVNELGYAGYRAMVNDGASAEFAAAAAAVASSSAASLRLLDEARVLMPENAAAYDGFKAQQAQITALVDGALAHGRINEGPAPSAARTRRRGPSSPPNRPRW